MWWCSVVVALVLAAPVSAAPHAHVVSHASAFAPAEKLWSAARDPAGWRAAADAFFAIAEAAASDADKLAAARSGWAAARNTVADDRRAQVEVRPFETPSPRPLSELDAWFVDRAELYERLDRASPDAVVAEFMRANTLRRYDQLEAANALYLDIVASHADHDVAEYAANLAADTFNRLEQYDQLVAFVERLRADKAFLARHPGLAHMLHQVHLMSLRDRRGDSLEGSREPRPYAEYETLGEAYLASIEPGETDTDELLYTAMVSFDEARDLTRAIEVGQRFSRELPHSRLAPRVVARVARSEADLGRYDAAARDLERYAALAPGEMDVRDALADALLFRVGLGELDRAARDLDAFAHAPHVDAAELARSTGGLAKAELDAGQRAAALRHVRAIRPRDAAPVALGLLLAELACPVALVDELCPRPRDPTLVAAARSVLERATDADDPEDAGRRVLIDLAVETGSARALADATLRYRELTGDRSDTRVIAHERLGRLAALAGHADEAAAEFKLCILEARDHALALPWLQRCERERGALGKPPVVAPLLEHLPAALAGDVTALEHL
jgi:tetratricopeptide (TPR) repeat protein